ncbi:hypothetical protein ACFO26_09325 [Lactococcus nasutitermitis]|uniref:Uncharacterized protein n=1 Tax=Lactococcus nasutitermitis TaxID=1652957 RepID=A0ABV9JF24_9LACT|nr:hypothetical protein [Lactococcus nasutitermitis]
MKNRTLSAFLVSTVFLTATATVTKVSANDSTDSQIAQQNPTISSAQSASAQAQAQVDSL